ncbi:DNA topoisomerase IB [bacterium]|nr:MAG: DNA topoisomerase IB [bacterium]
MYTETLLPVPRVVPPVDTLVPNESVAEALEEAGLIYTSDASPGIRRERRGDEFVYLRPNGYEVTDEKTLARIRSLAIPPAYEDVWICPKANGHLQATGKDARGRKQYRYHPGFREARDAAKFDRLADFGTRLPRVHKRIEKDLSQRGLPKDKVLATVVDLLERSLIRVGNEQYAKENKHFGLTTLRNRHAKVEGGEVKFRFVGKSGIKHSVALHDRKLANVVKKLQELPGQDLFQYVGDDGQPHAVSSSDVNDYLKKAAGEEFTAKDFRTWAASVRALETLANRSAPGTKKEAKAAINETIKAVSKELGNTPSVCRKCYVHPAVLDAFSTGRLPSRGKAEKALIAMLREEAKEKIAEARES